MNISPALLLLNLLWIFIINAKPLVKISQGTLNGTVQITRYGTCYSAFLGIPYAKPPTGNRRFKNPEPAAGWRGVRPAHSFQNICCQNNNGVISGTAYCLFLNIYTPFLNFETPVAKDKLLPVMVWIHGGSFLTDSSNMYGAGYLLQKDIILVTVNYRLGILGFLTTGDSVAPGNFGLKDQVEALKWVRKNIRSFGGDPNRVTLFGESAGGLSVTFHSLSKASNGLFQKYIIQSGTVLGPGVYQEKNESDVHVKNLAKLFNCPVNTSSIIVNCLRKVNFHELVKTSFLWLPVIESNTSRGAFLTDTPLNSINSNQMKDLPFMSGTVTEEGLVFTKGAYSNDIIYQILRSNIKKLITYIAQYYKQDVEKFFSAMDKFYFNNTFNTSSKMEFLNIITKFLSDGLCFYSNVRLLEKVTPKMRNRNYFYSFGYRGSHSFTETEGDRRNIGVAHADELFYLFPITHGSFITSNANFTRVDESISKLMVDFWTSFATNGYPTSNELTNPHLWQPYSPQTTAHIQIGNIRNNRHATVSMSNSYFTKRINFWRKNAPM